MSKVGQSLYLVVSHCRFGEGCCAVCCVTSGFDCVSWQASLAVLSMVTCLQALKIQLEQLQRGKLGDVSRPADDEDDDPDDADNVSDDDF